MNIFFRQSVSTKISHQEGKKEKCSQFQTTFLASKSSLRRSPMIVQTFASLNGIPWSKFSKGPVRPTSILSKALVNLCKNCHCRPVFPSKTSKWCAAVAIWPFLPLRKIAAAVKLYIKWLIGYRVTHSVRRRHSML